MPSGRRETITRDGDDVAQRVYEADHRLNDIGLYRLPRQERTMDDKTESEKTAPANPEAAAMYADLLEAAQNCYLMFQSLIEAGFSEAQAIQLVGVTLGGQR